MISATQTNVHQVITEANEKFMECFARGDAAGVAALYTPDAQILPPNGDVVYSPAAIQVFWQGVMNTGVGAVRLEVVEVDAQGDTASEISRYTLLGRDGQVLDQGKYVVIWKQVGGQWKLHRDIFNSSRVRRRPWQRGQQKTCEDLRTPSAAWIRAGASPVRPIDCTKLLLHRWPGVASGAAVRDVAESTLYTRVEAFLLHGGYGAFLEEMSAQTDQPPILNGGGDASVAAGPCAADPGVAIAHVRAGLQPDQACVALCQGRDALYLLSNLTFEAWVARVVERS